MIGKHKHFTILRALSDGRIFEITLAPFKDRDGRTVAIETKKDVTRRERAEEAIKKSEAKYRDLISRMSEGLSIDDGSRINFYKFETLRDARIRGGWTHWDGDGRSSR